MSNTIGEEWDSFLGRVIPKEASEVQKEEMRKAFYAGAYSSLQILMRIAEDEDLSAEQLERRVRGLLMESMSLGATSGGRGSNG